MAPVALFARGLALLAALCVAPDSEPIALELLVLDVEGLDLPSLEDALDTRAPTLPRLPSGRPEQRGGYARWGYAQIRPDGDGWALALILSDGHAYYRTIQARVGGSDERLVAAVLTNLIASIEEGGLASDEVDVQPPDLRAAAAEEPSSEDAPVVVEPRPDAVVEPEPDAQRDAATPPMRPAFEWGPYLGGVALLSPGAAPGLRFAGAGLRVGFDARRPSGFVWGGALRGLGRARAGYSLGRVRASAYAGASWRRNGLEVLLAVGPTYEPWFVRSDAGREALGREPGGDSGFATALGGSARLVGGLRRPVSERVALRVSGVIEASGSFVLGSNGVARVRTRTTPAESLFRVGGMELMVGGEVGVWWGRSHRLAH